MPSAPNIPTTEWRAATAPSWMNSASPSVEPKLPVQDSMVQPRNGRSTACAPRNTCEAAMPSGTAVASAASSPVTPTGSAQRVIAASSVGAGGLLGV
jgi:hypothetical protein